MVKSKELRAAATIVPLITKKVRVWIGCRRHQADAVFGVEITGIALSLTMEREIVLSNEGGDYRNY